MELSGIFKNLQKIEKSPKSFRYLAEYEYSHLLPIQLRNECLLKYFEDNKFVEKS